MLTFESDQIFCESATSIGHLVFFRQRTGLVSNPRQLGAMLTLETARIFFSPKNWGATLVN
ncbi:MAG: hypothetical protein DRR08_22135 [Candidatus Parabeggiatoa sp. nov. 2]|nr:MAG: hypothetical protein B6247_09875 [Beggiatoa sp. 4572_84]RKZ56281.1 MAG: hypothetical protein DRR08_22135 [Gammaproteobacteria bacterium]